MLPCSTLPVLHIEHAHKLKVKNVFQAATDLHFFSIFGGFFYFYFYFLAQFQVFYCELCSSALLWTKSIWVQNKRFPLYCLRQAGLVMKESDFLLVIIHWHHVPRWKGKINAKNGQSKNCHSFSETDFPQKVRLKEFTVGKVFSAEMLLF